MIPHCAFSGFSLITVGQKGQKGQDRASKKQECMGNALSTALQAVGNGRFVLGTKRNSRMVIEVMGGVLGMHEYTQISK